MYELEQLTVKELKSKLVELGIPEAEAAHFLTKGQIIATIKTLMAKKEVVTEHEEVKRVASLEEKPNPIEDREINKAWKDKAKRMKEHLEAQEKVNILIPTEPGEKPGVVEEKKIKMEKPIRFMYREQSSQYNLMDTNISYQKVNMYRYQNK